MKKKGFAIMLVLMMLFLLFMLGVAFFFSAWTHAFMARNYLNMKRAYVVAEGGVQTAVGAIIGDFIWAMHAQRRYVNERWRYKGSPGVPNIPVEYALNPSYALLDEEGKPRKITIFGKEVGLSGVMEGGAYGINSDIYHLKVMEASAQLYINEGLGHPYNTAVMRRILNNLGTQLGIDNLGTRIIDKRPGHGYSLKSELLTLDILTHQEYDTVKDFLCVHTWSDDKVCNPVPLSLDAKSAYYMDFEDRARYPSIYRTRPGYPKNIITRYGRGRYYDYKPGAQKRSFPRNHASLLFYDQSSHISQAIVYSYQELNPCWIEVTQRAPVNINTAPKEILVALICDLQGFFVMGQLRASTVRDTYEDYPYHLFSYARAPNVHGELGVLFTTSKIYPRTAEQIADHIIRYRLVSPFKTWREFNKFIDSLVWHMGSGIIEDPRQSEELNILDSNLGGPVYTRKHWDHYKYFASQAIADTIKANFNPNLHLNEINPDAQLYTWVDKTDLIVSSTEFCFLPTGYFEIESVGQILRAEWEQGKFHISPYLIINKDSFEHNNQIMGQRRLKIEVKLWDLYRETSQKDFMMGQYSTNSSQYPTNGNWGCESGPEPINGWAPFENEYEGYVTLATVGGTLPIDQVRIKGKLYRTDDSIPVETGESYTTMHAHYDFDFRLHHCKAGDNYRYPLTEGKGWGVKDWTEDVKWRDYASPYCAAYDPQRYRIARSYRYRKRISGELISPIDHRRDGWYAERFAHLPYYSGNGNFPIPFGHSSTGTGSGFHRGAISYWIKPGFHPEFNGYSRITFSINPDPTLKKFLHFSHLIGWAGARMEQSSPRIPGSIPPHSMLFYYPIAIFFVTPTLNHIHHDSNGPGWFKHDFVPSPLTAHRWVHVIIDWDMYRNVYVDWSKGGTIYDGHVRGAVYVNGEPISEIETFAFEPEVAYVRLIDSTLGGKNPFCLGGSRWTYRPAHCTIDEFYVATDYEIKMVSKKCATCNGTGRVRCTYRFRYRCYQRPTRCGPVTVPCPSYCKCNGSGNLQCHCSKKRKCKGGTGEPCRCRVQLKCKGGTGISCWCYWKRYRCKGKGGWKRCRWYCKCGGDGITEDCSYYCKCRGDGIIQDCPYYCRCKGDGRVPCYCPLNKACKRGELGDCAQGCPCGETGKIDCPECKGTGWISVLDYEELEIPNLSYTGEVLSHWRRGRYYRQNDAVFTSQEIKLGKKIDARLPVASSVVDPYGQPRWIGDEELSKGQTTKWLKQTWNHPKVKILGLTWTGYADNTMDYGQVGNPLLLAQLEVSLEIKDNRGQWVHVAGPFLNRDSGWAPVFVKLPRAYPQLRYRVRFNTRCDPANAILLETPVVDDITIYYMTRPQFLNWQESY
jgi:hypothetical protein